jgi:hypothetical protein
MTKLLLTAIIVAVITFFLTPLIVVHGLGGSATTIAVSYGSATTVCGIIAEQPIQRIQCWRNGQVIDVLPEISFESIAGGRDLICGVRTGGFSLLCWNSSLIVKRLYYSESVLLQDLTVGDNQICALTNGSRNATCWRDDAVSNSAPQRSQFRSISAGLGFTCGILMNNSVTCFGSSSMASVIQEETMILGNSMSPLIQLISIRL